MCEIWLREEDLFKKRSVRNKCLEAASPEDGKHTKSKFFAGGQKLSEYREGKTMHGEANKNFRHLRLLGSTC